MTHRTWRSALVVAGATAILGLGVTPTMANAAPGVNLPACATVELKAGITSQTVYVTNNCRYGISWMVDKEGPNTACRYSAPNRRDTYRFRKADVYHGTYRCEM